MGIRGLAAAQQARLLGHEPQVLLVAVAARRAQREHALVDPPGLMSIRPAARAEGFGSRNWIGRDSGVGARSMGGLSSMRGRRRIEQILQRGLAAM